MSSTAFQIRDHVVLGAPIRGVDRGEKEYGSCMQLSAKQYIPRNKTLCDGSFTVLVVHGIGTAKETFEPFFEELLQLQAPIRSIWIADAAHNAGSYSLNRDTIGDEVHWLDYSRDLFALITAKQTEMRAPLIGIGHSLGAGVLTWISTFHPRLFAGLIFVEAAFGPDRGVRWPGRPQDYPGVRIANREDVWSSWVTAAEALRRLPLYKNYDKRAFEKVLQHEIRDITPEEKSDNLKWQDGVTLVTPKEMEVYTWLAPDPPLTGFLPRVEHDAPRERVGQIPGFYRPEAAAIHDALPGLHPPLLYIWGTNSVLLSDEVKRSLVDQTGAGLGGSGGVRNEAVTEKTVEAGHMLPQEAPADLARVTATWLAHVQRTLKDQREKRKEGPPFIKGVQPELLARFAKL